MASNTNSERIALEDPAFAYPILNESVTVDENEVNRVIQILYDSQKILEDVNSNNINDKRIQLHNNLITISNQQTKWLNTNKGQVNGLMMSIYYKIADFATQSAALRSIITITPTIQTLFEELQSFARDSSSLSSNSQLKFNLLQGDKDALALSEYLIKPSTTFQNIIGFDKVKRRIKNLYTPLLLTLRKNQAQKLLLYGPPGTGKSFFIAAMANEIGADLYAISAAQLYDPAIGVSERKLLGIFNALRRYNPDRLAVIFFDEFEQLFPSRLNNSALELGRSLTVLLLQLINGVNEPLPGNIIIAAATNLLSTLDAALRSRMLPQILIDLPDIDSKRTFMHKYLLAQDINTLFSFTNAKIGPNLERFSNRDLFSLGEGILQYQLATVNEAQAFAINTEERILLNGNIGMGYIPVNNITPEQLAQVPLYDGSNEQQVCKFTDSMKAKNIHVLQKPDVSQFYPELLETINPITQSELALFKSTSA